jgi:hypothetical protein
MAVPLLPSSWGQFCGLALPKAECAGASAVNCKNSTRGRAGIDSPAGHVADQAVAPASVVVFTVFDVVAVAISGIVVDCLDRTKAGLALPQGTYLAALPHKSEVSLAGKTYNAAALTLLSHPPMRSSGKKVVRAGLLPSGAHVSAADAIAKG